MKKLEVPSVWEYKEFPTENAQIVRTLMSLCLKVNELIDHLGLEDKGCEHIRSVYTIVSEVANAGLDCKYCPKCGEKLEGK